ncbi:hypothetical protein ACFWWT_14360 [Streptomyces sp. NPDC058676]|uniref:hypothetical protein n=1 Tax=unclassified Streptomyces TaxID=2593676 RepID=UPI00364EF213
MPRDLDRISRIGDALSALDYVKGLHLSEINGYQVRTQVIEVDGSAEFPDCCAIDCGEEADFRLTRARGLFKRPYQLFACLDHADVARNALAMDVPPIT